MDAVANFGLGKAPRRQLEDSGFAWDEFKGHLQALADTAAGYRKGSLPIRLDPEQTVNPNVQALLALLRNDLDALRSLAPAALSEAADIDVRLTCTVPDGTSYFDLAAANPSRVFMVGLQDMGPYVREQLPHLARMPHVQGLWLFGNGLMSPILEEIAFSQLKNLRVLVLAENRITHLPDGLASCVELESLNLSNNPLRSLQPISALKKLRYLDVRQTPLPEVALAQVREWLPGCEIVIGLE